MPDHPHRRSIPWHETLAGYDRWATSYDATDNPMVAASSWVLQQQPLGANGADVVELGCGTGRHEALALRDGARSFTGVDGSSGMLQQAGQNDADTRVRWVHADIGATGLPAATFDLALIVLVLEHQRDPAPVCREAARLLRPGGRLRIVDIHPDLVRDGVNAHFHEGGREHHFVSFHHPIATIVSALRAAGFTDVVHREHVAGDDLLAAAPRLRKHAGRSVILDVAASRGGLSER